MKMFPFKKNISRNLYLTFLVSILPLSFSIHDEIPPFVWCGPISFDPPQTWRNRIIFFHIPFHFLIVQFLFRRYVPQPNTHTHTPALWENNSNLKISFIHKFIKYFPFAPCVFFPLLFTFSCSLPSFRPFNKIQNVEHKRTPTPCERERTQIRWYLTDTPTKSGIYSRVCFALRLHPAVRFALRWIALPAGWHPQPQS